MIPWPPNTPVSPINESLEVRPLTSRSEKKTQFITLRQYLTLMRRTCSVTNPGNEMENNDNHSMLERYRNAEALEHEAYSPSFVLNAQVYPHWIMGSNCFWYIREKRKQNSASPSDIGREYRLVNAEGRTNDKAFDHELLAQLLSQSVKRDIDPDNLPISQVKIEIMPLRVSFNAFGKNLVFEEGKALREESQTHGVPSPDGKKVVFVRDYNLWIRNLDTGDERPLTTDGEQHFAYGVVAERTNLVPCDSVASASEILWSPDSKQLLTVQTDERKVLSMPITHYVPDGNSVRPRCKQVRYALPGDEHITEYQLLSINVETGQICRAKYPPVVDAVLYSGIISGNRAWWSDSGTEAFFVDMQRGQKTASVVAFDANTGASRVLFEETSNSYIDLNLDYENPASLWPSPESNELIWFSERSGWAHLYLYDLETGELKNVVTEGQWLVREVLHFDYNQREVIVQVAGRVSNRDPYLREICRVNVDTGSITTLASSDHDYVVHKSGTLPVLCIASFNQASEDCSGISQNGRYIVATQTRVNEGPTTLLIDRDGSTVLTIETADTSKLPEGWQWPEPVKLKAADNKTDIYGVIFRPSDFSPDKEYPVIDWAMTSPFYTFVPKGAFGNDTMAGYVYMSAAALAELGFIVVLIDGRGTGYRSKAFHDESYGAVHTGSNLEDHITGIRQLAERYPYMDLDRVGIADTGGSSDGPVYGLLAFPDFYKVGVAMSIWDVRLLIQGEIYQGLEPDANYEQAILGKLARNLKGKLLLVHGMLDPFFHTSGYFQLIDALVRENCDFDMLVLPRGGHAWSSSEYGLRRMWDYLVTHLSGEKPPSNFRLQSSCEYGYAKLQSDLS